MCKNTPVEKIKKNMCENTITSYRVASRPVGVRLQGDARPALAHIEDITGVIQLHEHTSLASAHRAHKRRLTGAHNHSPHAAPQSCAC